MSPAPDLQEERHALEEARIAVQDKLRTLASVDGGAADALTQEYIDSVVSSAVERLQQELVVFGRIDDPQAWRIGLYGIDRSGDQLVVDWRTPLARSFYQAGFDDPLGLTRRVTYVGTIEDLFVEDYLSGEVAGSSPLMRELNRSRGQQMRAAVATLQSEQDQLVRLAPTEKLVLRGGPGTGKTVVGLHRAAWLVYNDTRLTAGRILIIGPSDKFLRFVAAVMPTLGEARIVQTTFDRLLGPSTAAGSDERWLGILDRYESSLLDPQKTVVGYTRLRLDVINDAIARASSRALPWRDRRKVFNQILSNGRDLKLGDVSKATAKIWPARSAKAAMKQLSQRSTLERLDAPADLIDEWLSDPTDGGLIDEVRARFEGVPSVYGHVIVDEAQDLNLLQLRAIQRRSTGLTLVGDDAQMSGPNGLGLRAAAARIGVEVEELSTAYRMSAEIADWLNPWARTHGIDAVELLGIRANGIPVQERQGGPDQIASELDRLISTWKNVALISAEDAWSHKGVEYDGVVVNTEGMSPAQVYIAASRAAHELVIIHPPQS